MHVCGFVSRFVRVCTCACMRVCVRTVERKLNPGSPDPIFSKHSIFILDTGETHDIISFAGRGH